MISHNQYAAQYQANNIRRGYNKFADLQAGAGYDDYDVSNKHIVYSVLFPFLFLIFIFIPTQQTNKQTNKQIKYTNDIYT